MKIKPMALCALIAAMLALLISSPATAHAQDVCPSYAGSEFGGTDKIDTSGEPMTVTVTAPDGFLVGGYCVKAGSDASGAGVVIVELDPPVMSVTFAHPTGKAISHYSAWWVPDDTTTSGEWCSPGYWRQAHHLDSWAATGYSPTDRYNDHIAAPAVAGDPTLWEVLQSPQTYGGRAFNAVGDLLSNAHPDVAFGGERVEDSCPLS